MDSPAEPRAPTERRRRLIVDKPFQYSLIRLLMAVWFFNTALLGGFIYYLYAGPVLRVDHLVGQGDIRVVSSGPPQLVMLIVLAALAGLALVTVVGIHMSNQIAGPLARVKSSLRQVASGDLSAEIRFRQGDYLTDLPDDFNAMLRAVRARDHRELEILHSVAATLSDASPERARLLKLIEEKESLLVAGGQSSETTADGDHDTATSSRPPTSEMGLTAIDS